MYCISLRTIDTNAYDLLVRLDLLGNKIIFLFSEKKKKSCSQSAVPPHMKIGGERLKFIRCEVPSEAHNLSPWFILTALS